MVSVNPQSIKADFENVKVGGYFLYDSSKPLSPDYDDDITYIGIPLMALCNGEFTDSRQRQLFKNIVYIGALSALLDIVFPVLEGLIGEQFKGKEKLFFSVRSSKDFAATPLLFDEMGRGGIAAGVSLNITKKQSFSVNRWAKPREVARLVQ